ncbi:MAG TPA: energy transducer TonB [Gemmatimonadaceae bacterium]|nr:energy transducer TonB [Gemmatimonadaceae bacterium]
MLRPASPLVLPSLMLGACLVVTLACGGRDAPPLGDSAMRTADGPPEEAPRPVASELPFRYPPSLYEKKVQGNVVLHLFVDRDGHVRPESTRVEESSGYPSLDSAAVEGSHALRFVPAKSGGEPVAVPILFPVYFRHPQAAALPGDTVLAGRGARGAGSAGTPSAGTAPGTP